MKTKLLAVSLLGASIVPLQAQLFRPEIVSGTALGAIAGAIIGNNSGDLHHDAWTGAAIGAGAGALLGAATAQANDQAAYDRTQAPYYVRRSDSTVSGSRAAQGALLGGIAGAVIGNNSRGHDGAKGAAIGAVSGLLLGALADASAAQTAPAADSVYASEAPRAAYVASEPTYYPSTAGRALQGAVLGGIAGALIGDGGRHHNGGQGAAIGAAAGLVLGALSDGPLLDGGYYSVGLGFGPGGERGGRHPGDFGPRGYGAVYWEPAPVVVQRRPVTVVQPATTYVQTPATTQPQQVTIINNYYGSTATSMSGANSLFGR